MSDLLCLYKVLNTDGEHSTNLKEDPEKQDIFALPKLPPCVGLSPTCEPERPHKGKIKKTSLCDIKVQPTLDLLQNFAVK